MSKYSARATNGHEQDGDSLGKEPFCYHLHTKTIEYVSTDFDTGNTYLNVYISCSDCGKILKRG